MLRKALSLLLVPSMAWACPFCDFGGQAVTWFIILFIGFISLGMLAFFFAYRKSGGMKNSERTALKVFEAENISLGEAKNGD